jgi:hypothetical protein
VTGKSDPAVRIEVTWPDGTVGTFIRQPAGRGRRQRWTQTIAGLTVTDYGPADVMRVMATATGTEEIAP